MQRLKDAGCIVHMSVKDREMIDLFRSKDDDFRKYDDSENISENQDYQNSQEGKYQSIEAKSYERNPLVSATKPVKVLDRIEIEQLSQKDRINYFIKQLAVKKAIYTNTN